LTAIPADTVRAVIDAGLVESIDYRPSRERELLARTAPLETEELNWVRQLADDPQVLEQSDYLELPAERRALIQDGAYRLVRYRVTGEERDAANAAQSYRLLQAINRNPPSRLEVERPVLPENGHESRTLQFGLGSRGDQAFAEYGLRMAYHDLQDNLEGFPMGAQIEIAQLRMRQYEGNRWKLQRLDLAGIRSLTPAWSVASAIAPRRKPKSSYNCAGTTTDEPCVLAGRAIGSGLFVMGRGFAFLLLGHTGNADVGDAHHFGLLEQLCLVGTRFWHHQAVLGVAIV